MNKKPHYSVIIQWSEEDQVYVVSLPEWGGCKTHGDTYEEAAKHAQEVIELLMETQDAGKPMPEPKMFRYPGADLVNLPESEYVSLDEIEAKLEADELKEKHARVGQGSK